MPTVNLPEWWVLVMPCGCIDGMRRAVIAGEIVTASAEIAWEKFTPRKRDRLREESDGWECRASVDGDFDLFMDGCTHSSVGR